MIEHRATSICIDALTKLRSSFVQPADDAAIAVGGAPEGDPYVLPSLMASVVLSDVGFRAVNLGPNTPLDVLSDSAFELNARLVWIAATSILPKTAIESALSPLFDGLAAKKIHLVVGGRASRRFETIGGTHGHRFASMSEMAGFAQGLLVSSP